ncbi:MAG: hypothetical protein WKF65_04310 [Gaiellaceae bacterium]
MTHTHSHEHDRIRAFSGIRLDLPAPSSSFRRRAWLEFQRALNPLAAPKDLPRELRQQPPA